MKARPILFRDEMVRALLDGRKTQTRRVVTAGTSTLGAMPMKRWPDFDLDRAWVDTSFPIWRYLHAPLVRGDGHNDDIVDRIRCRIAHPGDLLWVREAWGICPDYNETRYRADPGMDRRAAGGRWRPSIHMPRAASRLTLRVTGVRVERVQEISESDARAEGVGTCGPGGDCSCDSERFRNLWDSMRAGTEFAWAANPWVWVVEFEVIRANVNTVKA